MSHVIEGIILRKTPVAERDSIVELLLRSGSRQSVYVFGGQGSKNNKTAGKIEIGFNISMTVTEQIAHKRQNIPKAKDLLLKWSHQSIRDFLPSFYLMSFFCEVISLVSYDQQSDYDQDLFILLSNALFQLDRSAKDKMIDKNQHLMMFLTKLTHLQGINPEYLHCSTCNRPLTDEVSAHLDFQNGTFICQFCDLPEAHYDKLHRLLSTALSLKYSEINQMSFVSKNDFEKMLNYFLFQTQMDKKNLKTLSFL